MSDVPAIDELRKFIHHQIAEHRMLGNDRSVDELLEKLHNIEETHVFVEQTIGDATQFSRCCHCPDPWCPTRGHHDGCYCGGCVL